MSKREIAKMTTARTIRALFLAMTLLITPIQHSHATQGVAKQPSLQALTQTILEDTANTWDDIFQYHGKTYTPPQLKRFTGQANSNCHALSHIKDNGPFYCPPERAIYIDPAYLRAVQRKHDANCNFALAYIIAHEIGHHVQNEWGILRDIHKLPKPQSIREQQSRHVKTELMADCLAGVWASRQDGHLYGYMIKSGLKAAIHTNDPAHQQGGIIVAHAPTHGTLEQRITWFKRGYHGRRVQNCNTF